ncbi:hypothetical protein NDI44_25250 [Trichocoleus sp. DQ-A3]|uniref:hypothetical protein n=1 Tax=Cyanophyceae TaxID=3028117 RepID=UPI0016825C33|nr:MULTISPECIES: hypothetical protein [unclassified Coleofasciculus]MBD1837018.1 hypothetical protein [Coleofasciculus sp. FACHB-501]MBD1891679.1 hypothetical protein [Coleofasciculus sp. FACHB-SPT9]MBD1902843.1 hypothetical protein [Coleofasciculus sp. FACHB-125]MBD2538979.1 hypothetical protein [Coleofasciculus sp. FACHB-SPT36]
MTKYNVSNRKWQKLSCCKIHQDNLYLAESGQQDSEIYQPNIITKTDYLLSKSSRLIGESQDLIATSEALIATSEALIATRKKLLVQSKQLIYR